jgi:hypothetical protein
MLSCAVLFRKHITPIVETKQLSLLSVKNAIKVCKQELLEVDLGILEKSDVEPMNILIANDALLEKCLDQQSNVFASTVWPSSEMVWNAATRPRAAGKAGEGCGRLIFGGSCFRRTSTALGPALMRGSTSTPLLGKDVRGRAAIDASSAMVTDVRFCM